MIVRTEFSTLIGLSDRDALDALQPVYFNDMTPAQLAYSALLDGPPDALDIADASQALSR